MPPFTEIICPVIYDDLSSAKNETAFATSSGVPSRITGISSRSISTVSLPSFVTISVFITPGDTAFTVIPDGATSFASALVRPIRPAFDAE